MSAQVQRPMKVNNSEEHSAKSKTRAKENEKSTRKSTNTTGHFTKKHKHENDSRNFKFGRKRSQSFSAGGGKFFLPYKRRKKEGTIIPPTKFLLGGNIYDPLNLNSLQDEETNRAMNAVTPKSSPLPTPRHRKGQIEVIIPPNLRDPLNLISCEDDAEYEQKLVSPTKRGRKSRNRKKKRNSSSGGSCKEDNVEGVLPAADYERLDSTEGEKDASVEESIKDVAPVSNAPEPLVRRELKFELPLKEKDRKGRKGVEDSGGNKDKSEKKRKPDLKDKIVSPVIPQPGAWKRPPQYGHRGGGNMSRGGDTAVSDGRFNKFRQSGNWQHIRKKNTQSMPDFKEKNAYFQYGNYLRYYGYRNPQHETDHRLKYFAERREMFRDKDVLDIGCNIGHITLLVARDFGARSVVGLDIDRKLIGIARKNVRHYVNCADSPKNDEARGHHGDSKFFPISMPILFGPVDIPGISHGQSPSASMKFPHNVTFVQGNYVLDSDALLAVEQPQFDVILCLSLTKWIHLNWGDAGLKQAFRRMYLQLRPGGHLILEVQAWESYKKKKNLTEAIYKNYLSIEFFPHKFTEYLLSSEVGFTQCEVIGTPFHQAKGFRRPIQLFTKGEISPSRSAASNTNTPSHTVVSGSTKPPVYTAVSMSSREVDEDDECNANAMETEEIRNIEAEEIRNVESEHQESESNRTFSINRQTNPDTLGIECEMETDNSIKLEPDVSISKLGDSISVAECDSKNAGKNIVNLKGTVIDTESGNVKLQVNETIITDVKKEEYFADRTETVEKKLSQEVKVDTDAVENKLPREVKVDSDAFKCRLPQEVKVDSVKMEMNDET